MVGGGGGLSEDVAFDLGRQAEKTEEQAQTCQGGNMLVSSRNIKKKARVARS